MTREELLQIAKPVLFNTEMTVAILEDRKGATRRCIKPQPNERITTGANWQQLIVAAAAPCHVGDVLYVRETWFYEEHLHDRTAGKPDLASGRYLHRYIYKADNSNYPVNIGVGANGWHPSIHMPKEAARIFLRVTDVRAERLQDIIIEDIRKEGLTSMAVHAGDTEIAYEEWKLLWDSTIKKSDIPLYGWDANPWVWVIEFERIETDEYKTD